MKKILLSLLIVFSIGNVCAQSIVNRAGDANTVRDGRFMAKLNMYPPVYADTTAANVQKGVDSCYAIIATRDVNGFWYRECSPKRWVRISGSSVNSTTITNISITNITDSSVNIQICVGTSVCDTITINNITVESPTTVELLNDTTIIVCNADAQCDTAIINRQQFLYFFQNVLTQISPGIVEFGGAMLHGTSVTYNDTSLLELYTSRDVGIPNYPNTRIDPPLINVLGTDANGVFQSVPYVNQTKYGIVSGGMVTWVENYDYNVSPATYYINGAAYTSPDTVITLDAADPTYDRIDAFVVNENGDVEVIKGTPSADPQQPSVDPETQLLLTFALVTANTTEPPNIDSECLYQENAEWTASSSSARINVASTSNPCGGTYNIEGTAVIKGDYFTLTRSVAFDPRVDHNALILQIKSKGNWGNANQNRKLLISWKDASGIVGQFVTLANGTYGFNASNTSDCQTITIPLSNFFLPSTVAITELLVTAFTTTGTFGFYIDNICLQGGGGITPPTNPTGITSVGNLPPLFTTTTTANAVTFNLSNAGAYEVFGRHAGTTGAPSYSALTAQMIPTDLGYYKNMEQLTDTSIALIRGDLTRDTIAVTKGRGYAANGLTMRNDSTVVLGGGYDENTTLDGNDFYTRFTDTRVQFDKGTTTAAANDLTLPNDGNLFTISGATQINTIVATDWQAGSEIAFIFTGAPLVKNNTAGAGATLLLSGRVDFQAAGGDYISFRYDGTNWYETQRQLVSGGGGTLTANNGLTMSTATNVQLGGTLLANTTITGGANNLLINGSDLPLQVTGTSILNAAIRGTNASGGTGIEASTSSGVAVGATSSSGIALQAQTGTGSFAISGQTNPASTNTVTTVMQLTRLTSGTGANGLGQSIDFYLEPDASTARLSNQLISKWTTATDATRTSQFIITGVLNATTVDVLTLNSNGSIQLRPITATAASAITPAEGMLLFVSNTDATFTSIGLWCYENGAWSKK